MAIEPLRMVYTNADWTMTTTLTTAAGVDLNAWYFFGGLIAFNLLCGRWARKVLAKKLA